MSDVAYYKVVQIISPYKVVINGGSDAGLKKGQRFLVYALGEIVKDPDSGEDLEQIEIVKGSGVLTHLQKKIATIESDMENKRPTTIRRRPPLGGMRHILGETEEIRREYVPFEEPQIGDLVRPYGSK